MSFRKPFRAKEVILGPYCRAEQKRARRRSGLRQVGKIVVLTLLVFLGGMAVTNWKSISANLPVYYWNCASARADGAAPISRGTAGYRSGLDADGDGIACEPYGER